MSTQSADPESAAPVGPEGNRPGKGRLLRPSSAGVIKQALNHYLRLEPDFAAAYFPLVQARGYSNYDDVFEIDDNQVDALRPLMTESILHFLKEDGRERNRNVNLIDRRLIDDGFESRAAKKAKLWTEALRDLCSVFGLESPV
jgi:hypothetical protein